MSVSPLRETGEDVADYLFPEAFREEGSWQLRQKKETSPQLQQGMSLPALRAGYANGVLVCWKHTRA
jgi:hypothetical protein